MPATLPAAFAAALALDHVAPEDWIEVEGLPWAYGLVDRAAGWFAARSANQQRLGVAGVLLALPRGAEQELRPLDAESSVGQFQFQLQLDDAGTVLPLIGNGARRDGMVVLSGDIDSTSAVGTINFTGSAAAFPASGVLYLGRETFTYTGKGASSFTGCARGAYALPGHEARQAHTSGDLISAYPRFLSTRRVAWYCTLDGTDAGRVNLWSGTMRTAKLMAGGAGVELTAESLDGDLKVQTFTTQRTGKLGVGIVGADGGYVAASDTESAAETTRLVLAEGSTSGAWTHGSEIIVRLGDEYLAGTVSVSGTETAITILGRGQFNSAVVQHVPGDDLVEVMWTGARNASGSAADQVSKFSAGDHPLEIALQRLLSRKGDGANGTYDTLPEGWGIGLDASRVDVAGILALKRTWLPAARHLWVYEEPHVLKEMLGELLRPHGCYPVSSLGDLLRVLRLSPPIPGASLRTIDASSIVAVPTWDANTVNVIGRVVWRCDHDPVAGDFRQTFKGEMVGPYMEAQEFYAGLWKTLELDAKGQFTGNDSSANFFGAGLSTGADEASLRYFEMVRDRYARPFPAIGVECSFDYLDVEVGDLVTVTATNLPDVTTGALGLAGAICEVTRRSIDRVRGVVQLTLLHSTAANTFRLLAPSGIVSATGAGTITLTDGAFNDSGQDRTAGFYAGQVVVVFSSDLRTARGLATLTSVSATQLGMATVPAGTVAGDVVTLQLYSAQPAIEKSRHAFMASTSELLNGVDSAHTYAT